MTGPSSQSPLAGCVCADLQRRPIVARQVRGHHTGSCRRRLRVDRGEPAYPIEDRPVQGSRDRHLRQLERHVAGVAHHLTADLDQPVPQRGQRPVPHTRRQRHPT